MLRQYRAVVCRKHDKHLCLTKLDKYIRSAHSATERSSAYPICLCLIDKRYLRSAEGKFETLQLTITFQASFGVPVSAQQSTNHQFRFVKTHVPPAEGRCTHSALKWRLQRAFLGSFFPAHLHSWWVDRHPRRDSSCYWFIPVEMGSFFFSLSHGAFSEVITGQVLFLPLVLLLAAEARAGGFILFFHSNIFRFSTPRRFEATPLLRSPA